MGAAELIAVDIDPDSASTTRSVLERHAAGLNWRVLERSIFDISPAEMGTFDVVYSWGVLHHSGNLERALAAAAALVAENGVFAVALYSRTLLCPVWTMEKKWYSKASPRSQTRARALYIFLYRIRSMIRREHLKGDDPGSARRARGMDFYIDVHDWMGGYPYESISVKNMDSLMQSLKFDRVTIDSLPTGIFASLGIFGSGCTEFVYKAAARGSS
jgi:2-polyprenyl-6-hydroxyphenyl methylase/3-demethylubiquinone-9 3-methyltransferase